MVGRKDATRREFIVFENKRLIVYVNIHLKRHNGFSFQICILNVKENWDERLLKTASTFRLSVTSETKRFAILCGSSGNCAFTSTYCISSIVVQHEWLDLLGG